MNAKTKILFFILPSIFFLNGCGGSHNDPNGTTPAASVSGSIVDSTTWYSLVPDSRMEINSSNTTVNGVTPSLLTLNVNIPIPNTSECAPWNDQNGTLRPCTLDDVDHDLDGGDSYSPVLNATMSSGTFSGSAQFDIRGNYTRTAAQKSYAIKLDSTTALMDSQRKYQLNKHQSDRSRMKNKLAFDLFKEIPNITSLKTQFVNLKITDDVNGTIDYGLFTHVEAIRKEYLVNRGWNKDDNLYNAAGFSFDEWALSRVAVDANGQPLDNTQFQSALEIKRGTEHSNVSEMVSAVINTTDIDAVIEKYFNRDNYMTWLATNLILGNKDTTYHNFFLYNPLYSKKFYFLPWDYDGAWSTTQYLGKSEYGISVWWEVPLHRKFLSIKKNRDDLYALTEYIRANYITDAKVQALLDAYEPIVRPFQSKLPDSGHNSDATWLTAKQALVTGLQANIDLYKSVIGDPMPFRETAEYNSTTNIFSASWDESVDLEGDTIVYDLNVSSDYDFNTTLISEQNLTGLTYTKNINLASGTYYLKVIAKDDNNASSYQEAFDLVTATDSTNRYGVKAFQVP